MCHAIVWYHALCQHLDDSLSSLISCHNATQTGDDCLAHEWPIVSLPLSGSCSPCKYEQLSQEQQYTPQEKTDMDLDTEVQPREIRQKKSRKDETGPWAHEPEPIPGYHTHLYPRFEAYNEPTSWLDLEEVEVDIADYEHLLSPEPPRYNTPASSPELGKDWCSRDSECLDSPTLGNIVGRWDPISHSEPPRWQSMIPLPAVKDEAKERAWDDSDVELFDRLTF